jgi:general stress protein 26
MESTLSRVWEIIEQVGVCMLTTQCADGRLRARPLEARPDRQNDVISFVTDCGSAKEHEIEANPNVGLIFIDAKANAYLSITAKATVCRDGIKAAELWRSTDSMWWDGPSDSNVCVIHAELLNAEIWDGPSMKAVEVLEFIRARLTGQKADLGENRKTAVKFR